jgi:nitroreductase
MDRAMLERIVGQARLAPSVHNVQPTRWSLDGEGRIALLDTPEIRIPVADPNARDIWISHGAALEGTLIALAAEGLHGEVDGMAIRVTPGAELIATPEAATRATWRGMFAGATDVAALQSPDLVLVSGREAVAHIAGLGDEASMHFLEQAPHRQELLHWMRLTRGNPRWDTDGLNAEAMALSPLEARAAGLVLGPLFSPLDAIGLAEPLLSEKAKTASAAAIALFHRPAGEEPLETGRAFYRAWLAMERAGFAACPISVLADWAETNRALAADHGVPAGRSLISVFRIGVPVKRSPIRHARRPVADLIAG